MNKFINRIKRILFDQLFGNLKGYKTIIINLITFIIGLWTAVGESGLYEFACNWSDYFCTIEQSKFYGAILAIIAVMNKILRFLTDSPVFSKTSK